MAAFNESGPSRKRIATYGKAARRRAADHTAFEALQDPDKQLKAPTLASILASTEPPITSSPSTPPENLTTIRMFDVPSSDDNTNKSPHKKRKIAHVAHGLGATPARSKQHLNHTISNHSFKDITAQSFRSQESTHFASPDYRHGQTRSSKSEETTQPLFKRRSGKVLSRRNPELLKKRTEGRAGLVSRQVHQDDASANYSSISSGISTSFELPNTGVGSPVMPRKVQDIVNGMASSQLITSPVGDCEAYDSSTTLPVPSIITPKGVKMWNYLLDETGDKDSEPEISHHTMESSQCNSEDKRSSSRDRKLPRRRLIDSLVEQSTNPRFSLDLYTELPEVRSTTSESSSPSQTSQNLEEKTSRLANAPALTEKINNPTKVLAFGQGSQPSGTKITYSRQRSMLAEQELVQEPSFDIPLRETLPMSKPHNRRGSIPVLAPLPSLCESMEVEVGSNGVAIRTIHELRQAGAESRFKDEVEDLLDRIGKPAPQNITRRSGLIELIQRMKDQQFYTKFVRNGVDQRLFFLIGQEQDVISGFIFISILIPILDAGTTPVIINQLRRQGIIRLLIRLLSIDESILAITKSRKSNMSKLAQTTLREQHDAFLQMRVWGDLKPQAISPRTASLSCLELMVRQSREAGHAGDIISKELVCNLFDILKASYYKSVATADSIDFQLTLSTLVSHSLNPMTGIEEFLPIVGHILEAIMQETRDGPTVILLLRLVLNTTNNSPAASDAFASPALLELMCHAVIEKFRILSDFVVEDKRLILVDHLVLILVVMINIAELSIRARESFLSIQDNSLGDLVVIFQDNIERAFEADSVEDSHRNVAGGYLAVLLGCLSLIPEIRDRIRMRQQTFSVQPLIACIDEFISHHKKVDALLKIEAEHNPQIGLTGRLQTLVDELKEKSASE